MSIENEYLIDRTISSSNCENNQNILIIDINDINHCSTTSINSSQTSTCSNASLDPNSVFNNFEYWSKSLNNFDLVKVEESPADSDSPNLSTLTNQYLSRLYKPLDTPRKISSTPSLIAGTVFLNKKDSSGLNDNLVCRQRSLAQKMDLSQSYSIPLSIDFTRKLKRPAQIPFSIDASNVCSFQGSILEEWLMLSFEEHLRDSSSVFRNEINSLSTSATNSATSFIIEYSYTQNLETDEITYISTNEPNKLNSESYKAAINNCDDNGNDKRSDASIKNDDYLSKKQEANFYVQQMLTDLLALGVMEFESAFEGAINKTYKVFMLQLRT